MKKFILIAMAIFLPLAAVGCGVSEEINTSSPPSSYVDGTTYRAETTVNIPSTVETTTTTTTIVATTSTTKLGPTTTPYKVQTTVTYKPTTTQFIPPTTQVAKTTQVEVSNGVGGFLQCVRGHESDTAGGYSALNPSSGAGGAYQLLPSTWNNVANHIGRGDLVGVPPHTASPATQDMMATALLNWYGKSPWNGTGC